jgi:hypothetical protein
MRAASESWRLLLCDARFVPAESPELSLQNSGVAEKGNLPAAHINRLCSSCWSWRSYNMNRVRVLICVLLISAFASAQVTFSKTAYGANQSPGSAITGDFNKDGKPDFAVVEAGTLVTIYLNIGSGKFSKKAQYAIASNDNPIRIDTADMNGDGKLDIVIGKQFVPEFEIWFGNGDGTFTFGKDVNSVSPDAYSFALGDVDNDGKVDLVSAYNDDTSSFARTFLNDGAANFTPVFGVTFTGFASNFALADFDRDGKLDVLARVHDQLQVYKGDGAGSFALSKSTTVPSGDGTITYW